MTTSPASSTIGLEDASTLLKGVTVPPRPQLLSDISRVYPDIRKTAAIIRTDQGVSAGVLRAVNSPLYGLPRKVSSIDRAVVLLGLSSVLNIVNALFLRAALGNTSSHPVLSSYWRSSTDAAIACASISRHLRLGMDEQAYLTGLFHNCGIPLMLKKFPDYLAIVQQSYAMGNFCELEQRHYETDHMVVGYVVARYWKLPDAVCVAIREHHHIGILSATLATIAEEARTLIAVLKIAEHAAALPRQLGMTAIDHEWTRQEPAISHFLGLSKGELNTLLDVIRTDIEDAHNGMWPEF